MGAVAGGICNALCQSNLAVAAELGSNGFLRIHFGDLAKVVARDRLLHTELWRK
jgi:hypothetical protein